MKKFLCFLGILALLALAFFAGRMTVQDPVAIANHLDENGYDVGIIVNETTYENMFDEDSGVDIERIKCIFQVASEEPDSSGKTEMGYFFSCEDAATAKDVHDFMQDRFNEMKENINSETLNSFTVIRNGTIVFCGHESIYTEAKPSIGFFGLFGF